MESVFELVMMLSILIFKCRWSTWVLFQSSHLVLLDKDLVKKGTP